jgi:hypothetical protein
MATRYRALVDPLRTPETIGDVSIVVDRLAV